LKLPPIEIQLMETINEKEKEEEEEERPLPHI